MDIQATGTAVIRQAGTGELFTILPDDLEWYEVGSDDREMGPEITYEAEVDHEQLGPLIWRIWEYPIGAENDREVDVGPHALVQNFNISATSEVDPEERAARVQTLVDWFHENYEDPAERTPYESAEGGYIWIWGGPYSAREVLEEEFDDVSEAVLEAAVREIEADGFEWAPKEQPGDYDDPDPEEELSRDALDAEREVLSAPLDDAEVSLASDLGPKFGIDETGQIGVVGWTPTADLPADALREGLKEAIEVLVAKLEGTNAHQALLAAARRYLAAVGHEPLSIARLYVEGTFLASSVAQLERDVIAEDLPALPSDARQALDSVTDLHATYIMASPEGRDLFEGAARFQRTPDVQAALDRSVAQVAVLVEEAREIFSPEVRAYAAEFSKLPGNEPRKARSNQVVSIVLGGVLLAASNIATATVGDGFVASPIGIAAVNTVTAMSTMIGNFLAQHTAELQIFANLLGQELGALRFALSRLSLGR